MKKTFFIALPFFSLIMGVSSCHDKPIKPEEKTVFRDSVRASPHHTLQIQKSAIRPSQELLQRKTYIDTVRFVEFLNGGDYNIFMVKKNQKNIQLYGTPADSISDFVKGEKVVIHWKMDTIWDPEHTEFNFYECLLKIEAAR